MASDSIEHSDRLRAAEPLRQAAEVVLFALVVISPWPFAAVESGWRFALFCGVAILTLLWFVHVLVSRQLVFRTDAVTVGLFGLILFTAIQTIPLPESILEVMSPATIEYVHQLRPEAGEILPGEREAVLRPTSLPISFDVSRTRDMLVKLVALFLAYTAARNFVFRNGSFQRLAWLSFGNGMLLALIALMQFFSSPRTMVFWSFPTEGQVFGPFVCKNHYPFYLSICMGLGLALLLEEWQRQERESAYHDLSGGWLDGMLHSLQRLQTPKAVLLLGGLGLMLASVPFSLSRGGLLSVVAAGGLTMLIARLGRLRSPGVNAGSVGGGLVLVLIVVTALGFGAWFGWKPVEERLNTLWQGKATLSTGERLPLWRDLSAVARDFPAVGAGAGTTLHLEVMTRVRTDDISFITYDHAHNDYLEALIEGGIVRLALTLLIVVSVLWTAAAGYVRHRHRSISPYLLGSFFGLAEIALHSFGDFGIHIPAVALFAGVTAAFVMASKEQLEPKSDDSGLKAGQREKYVTGEDGKTRIRRRVRVRMSGAPSGSGSSRSEYREGRVNEIEPTLMGLTAIIAVFCAVLAAGLVIRESWRAWNSDRWQQAAGLMATDYDDPDRMKKAAENMEGALAIRPDVAAYWNDLAGAWLADAYDKTGRAAAAAAGPTAYLSPTDAPPPDMLQSHVMPALRAARKARDLCPILSGPHLRLGTFARSFAKSEPANVHLGRAKKTAPGDADVRFLSGADALARGDRDAAFADWKEAIVRSHTVLPLVLRSTSRPMPPDGKTLSPQDLRTQVLPDDPSVWILAADLLFPDTSVVQPERLDFLRAANQRWKSGPPTKNENQWLTWGNACEELGESNDALNVWRRGVETYPDSEKLRDRFANRLEENEQYTEALPHLEWLRSRMPGRLDLRDRQDAANHALKLQKEIDGK